MVLKRISYTEHGTFGVLLLSEIPFAVTIELPWKDNAKNVSCIPMGIYRCCLTWRADGTRTFRVMNVPERDDILFHKANTIADLKGCIGIAEEFGEMGGKPAVLSSGRGFREFMEKLAGLDSFDLEVC
ncbi:MAG: DUF5675 family protein [Acidobacteriia bacterium]|nr:DUF5675 family protein [Terriglobia bacterium]